MATRRWKPTNRANWRKSNSRTQRTRSFNKGGRPWSAQEIAFLRKFYRCNETKWVARQLGRTAYSVRYKASSLNIRKYNPSQWKGNHGVTSPKPAQKRYGRSHKTRYYAQQIRRRQPRMARSRRITRTNRW
ncbi:MAG: hypothetical protein AB1644_12415 [Candidatus Zixiibacteriota bacterium]